MPDTVPHRRAVVASMIDEHTQRGARDKKESIQTSLFLAQSLNTFRGTDHSEMFAFS